MAQLDWMMELDAELSDGDFVVNFVSSADIDTVLIHLFGISLHWKRNQSGAFTRPVYVWLQKQKPELYNISKIIESIERYFNKKYSAALIAIILSMAGNDFLPRHYGISYEKILMKATDNQGLELFKHGNPRDRRDLYCPKIYNAAALSFDEVRQMTIKMPGKEFRLPQTWMPPESALRHLGSLIQTQIEYFFTTWCHEATLPDFRRYSCISMHPDGEVYYSFGDDVHVSDKEQLLSIPEEKMNCAKQTRVRTSKKRALPDTPRKQNPRKRQPLMSTPR
ncbi:hypothetical protein ACJMK2_005520 [Sinanodonta woodiana]|uniref:Uncharacterized protein n=1 Tax=Sinanodonta woodiana TaxID=1069815 RepID=A0ABD3VTT8_SINWO